MMSFLPNLDPGYAVTRAILGALVQSSVVILLAALLARAAFSRRADARHALWLGVLVWVLLSPIAAGVADHSGRVLWHVTLPLPSPREAAALDATISDAAVVDPLPRSDDITRDQVATEAEPYADSGTRRSADGGKLRTKQAAASGVRQRVNPIVAGLTLLWAAGLLVGLARIAVGWRQLRALSRVTRPLEIARHGATLERVCAVLRVEKLPLIVTSPTARGPVAVGLLRPRIVLPEGLAESISARSLCDVLVHECAHVIRRDSWVGLLQRLAGAMFWPHPGVHYLNGQLTRAREEVCDNFVLRCGDPCGYARTLLALTTVCRPKGALRPGLGLLAARWTLADRVAGLIDPGRSSMTRTSFRLKMALAIALVVTGLSAASVRFSSSAQAGQPKGTQVQPKITSQVTPNADYWNIEGVVVDEQSRPVAGAVVRTMPLLDGPANVEHKTAPDGTFRFTLKSVSPSGLVGLMAEANGAARMGLDRSFDRRRAQRIKEPSRIVLKPSRSVTVRVKDAAGAAVPGATVEAAEIAFRTHAASGPDGTATLRIPADAQVEWVIGFKPGAGFDYFENYDNRSQTVFSPLPEAVMLTLELGESVRIMAVGSNGQRVPGVVIYPDFLYRTGKKDSVQARLCATATATTDKQGVAYFDWLPNGPGDTQFNINPAGGYSCIDSLVYEPLGPADLIARVRRATRLSGTVRFPDGRPAGQVHVRASGWGRDGPVRGIRTGRTADDGRYALDIPPEHAYIVAVIDDTWAAQSLMNVVVREGQTKGGLDFTLIKGTLLRGQITEGPGHRPSGGVMVMLDEKGELLPKDYRGLEGDKGQLMRATMTADAEGRYQFRVGPGRYTVQGFNSQLRSQGGEDKTIEVKQEAEIVRDVTLKVPSPERSFKGIVVEKTATGERPVAKARIILWPLGSSGGTRADDQGRFEFMRKSGEILLFAYSEGKGLASFTPVSADSDNATVIISKAATITGRVIDTDGKPRARNRVGIWLSPLDDYSTRFGVGFFCDEQGRFTFRGAPARSHGELSAPHDKDANGRRTRARTVMPFDVPDLDPVEVSDLVVPAQGPAR